MSKYQFETLQVHAGHKADPTTGSCATPIYQTAAYAFKNIEEGRKIFALEQEGYIYSRITNPTVDEFEKRIAALENGSAAVASSSGISSQWLIIQALCNAGDNIVSSISLYGGTYSQFKTRLPQNGTDIRFCSCTDEKELESQIDSRTRFIYVETIANSDLSVPDFEMISRVAQHHHIPLVTDNTVGCGGYLCRPFEYGANIITHSATKWICGHGNSIAGIAVDGGNFDWSQGDFPGITSPTPVLHGKSYTEMFGNAAFAGKLRNEGLRDFGCCLSPFNAFLLLTGVETLSLRAQRVSDNALAVAKWLEQNKNVAKVNYPGLESSPSYGNAKKYLRNGFGGIIMVDLKSSKEETAKIVERLKIFTLLANLGDNKSLVAHPASTTHDQLNEEELRRVGITPGTLRLCIGIENINDLIEDLDNAVNG